MLAALLGRHDLLLVLPSLIVACLFLALLYQLAVLGADAPVASAEDDAQTAARGLLERWLARARFTAEWADGSEQEWNVHLRPMLAREFEESFHLHARHDPDTYTSTGLALFGSTLWPWVDPREVAPARQAAGRPGPGRAALTEILSRLERS
ncbi:hypothetical protein [Lolliginicoccus suaedae]|uniref:hypothetical protein n=1 Tax=Lolliginicoccus suaedae TaxID=2605429 RepID=UPI0011EE49B9|nr:hypothetical protein [Lolliginicoccus suaedae]